MNLVHNISNCIELYLHLFKRIKLWQLAHFILMICTWTSNFVFKLRRFFVSINSEFVLPWVNYVSGNNGQTVKTLCVQNVLINLQTNLGRRHKNPLQKCVNPFSFMSVKANASQYCHTIHWLRHKLIFAKCSSLIQGDNKQLL